MVLAKIHMNFIIIYLFIFLQMQRVPNLYYRFVNYTIGLCINKAAPNKTLDKHIGYRTYLVEF